MPPCSAPDDRNVAEGPGARHASRVALALALAIIASPAAAQSVTDAPSYLEPKPLRSDNPLLRPGRDYIGMSIGDWMFYPQFLSGAVYDDNVLLTQTNRVAAAGARLQPQVQAVRDAGVSTTSVEASLDARLYPGLPRGDAYDGRVVLDQAFEPQPDFSVKGHVEYGRLEYPTDGGQVATPSGGVATLVSPQQGQQAEGAIAIQKAFGRLFLGASLAEVQTTYDPLASTAGALSQSYRNSLVTTATERGGYWLTPMLYGYTETAENWREYADQPLGSHGYRGVVGLGSDRISLFRGEIYGGWQKQIYGPPLAGVAGSPVFGGKVWWYPTRAWTASISLDETFSDSSNPTPSNPRGDPARGTTARATLDYRLSKLWSAQASERYDHSVYLGASRIDDDWTSRISLKYEIARNVELSLDYAYMRVDSNAAGASYYDDIVGLGGVYKF
jgi:hypothetical protein